MIDETFKDYSHGFGVGYEEGQKIGYRKAYRSGFEEGYKQGFNIRKEVRMKFDEILQLIMDLKKQMEEVEEDDGDQTSK